MNFHVIPPGLIINHKHNCPIDVYGNIIMMNAQWYYEMQHKCHRITEYEKQEILGDIYTEALNNVDHCCQFKRKQNIDLIILGIIISSIFAVLMLFFCCMCIYWRFRLQYIMIV